MQGYGNSPPCTPPPPPQPTSIYEERAAEWFTAKERLVKASSAADMASKTLAEAREVEAAAWRALEEAAERGPQLSTTVPRAR